MLNRGEDNLRQRINLIILLISLCFFVTSVSSAGEYVTSDEHVYDIRYLVEVQNTGEPALNYKLKFPVFLTQKLPPYQKVFSFKVYHHRIKLLKHRNETTAQLSLRKLAPHQRVKLEIRYTLVNSAIRFTPEPVPAEEYTNLVYLKPDIGIESDHLTIVSLAENITAGDNMPLEKAKRLFEYVNTNLKYQPLTAIPHSALKTLERGNGSCEDFSLLYIALCRAVGIPARFISGYRFDPGKIGKKEVDLDQFAHAWVEIYLPDTGWIPVEPTFTYIENGVKRINYDFFGRILSEDRHLFFSYCRQQERSASWNYETPNPTDVVTKFRVLIRRR